MTSCPPCPFVSAIQPPNPSGVGAALFLMVTRRSFRGMFTFSTPSLKSPALLRAVSTAWYSLGISCALADPDHSSAAATVKHIAPRLNNTMTCLPDELTN